MTHFLTLFLKYFKSEAFLESVRLDRCLRKNPKSEYFSDTNPNGLAKGYGIGTGILIYFYKGLLEKSNKSYAKNLFLKIMINL